MIRFILGLVSGVAIGVAAASASQTQGGQDLRAEFDRMRADLQEGNYDAVGAHLEERFKELQISLEERFAEVEDAAAEVADDGDDAAGAAEEAVEEPADAAGDATEAKGS
jgi:hypothetical protein